MKHFKLFIFVFIISTKALFSQDLAIKYITPLRNNLIIFLEDNSIWEIFDFDYRFRTWTEWWNGVELRKDANFIWNDTHWLINDYVAFQDKDDVIFCLDALTNNDMQKYNQSQYVLINQDSFKQAFARQINLEFLIEEMHLYAIEQYESGYTDGHISGYSDGYSDGYSAGSSK